MGSRTASLFTYLLLPLSLALLAAAGAAYLGADNRPSASLRLEQADWQNVTVPAFSDAPQMQDAAALPRNWQRVELPLAPPVALLRQARPPGERPAVIVTWLRLRPGTLPLTAHPLALYGARIKTDGTIAVYIDGQLAYRDQQDGLRWNSSRTPLWFTLDSGKEPREILLRLEHSERSRVAASSFWLGPVDALRPRYLVRQWLQQELPSMLSAAFLAVGLFALFVWLRRRDETGYLLFFCLGATAFFRTLHFYSSLPIRNDWFAWLTVNSLFWLVLVVHIFLLQLHGRPQRAFTGFLVALTVSVALLTQPLLPLLHNTPKVTPLIYVVAALMGAAVCAAGIAASWRRSGEGMPVACGIGICVLLGISDWLLQNNFVSPEGWYLGAYTNAICFATFGSLMYRRYLSAIEEAEQLNASLAHRLRAREAELEESHRRLRDIELRQTISEERQRLMQDMHDGFGSSLIGAIRSVEHGRITDAQVSRILKDCLDDLKLTIDSMEPVESDLLLLLATLRFRLEPRLEGSNIGLRWEVQEVPALPWLDPSRALHVLRILQECVANILRHTRATEIRVRTAASSDGVQVSIEDNGQGFDPDRALAAGSGRGLQNQRRRAAVLGGTVRWESGPEGTRFTLWLPLCAPGQKAAEAA
ncbi:sensor histidine kinase [Massilia endophytica]|uniref:sensor histidine kinase n=1 Tax=Massilia endophytica TaxID=2899220 RepID=UPI001E3AC5B6|nr:sensor histidine kinase [Massilia endophytica]UGQ45908.1 sensor histidine kinase [Massilia endophytica]